MRAGWRSAELLLTPILGLAALAIFILKHDDGKIADDLPGRVALFIAFGALPLVVTALIQGAIRLLKWSLRAQVIAAGLIGCLVVGLAYFFIAPYVPIAEPYDAEGRGDIIDLLRYEAESFGLIGAVAAILSSLLAHGLIRRRALQDV